MLTDEQLLDELREEIARLQAENQRVGSFAEDAYRGALFQLHERLHMRRSRWKYFDEDLVRDYLTWAFVGGVAVTEREGRFILMARDRESLFEQGHDLGLRKRQIKVNKFDKNLVEVLLTDAQVPVALTKTGRRRDALERIWQGLELLNLRAPGTYIDHILISDPDGKRAMVGDWLNDLPMLLRGAEFSEEIP